MEIEEYVISQIVFLITTKCNLRCKLCYIKEKEPLDISFDTIKKAFETLPLLSLKELIISGGEPFLRPDLIFRLLDYIKRYKPNLKISIQSNGTLLDDSIIKKLNNYNLNIGIGISIDGPISINDSLRGKTSLVLDCLDRLSRYGNKIGITITISKYNYSNLSDLLMILAHFPCVRFIGLDPLRPIGNAKEKDIAPLEKTKQSLKEFKRTLYWINRKREESIIIKESLNKPKKTSYCYAANGSLLVIHPNGSFWPCPSLINNKNFCLGNIKDGIKHMIKLNMLDPNCYKDKNNCPGRCPVRSWLSLKAGLIDCIIRKIFLDISCNML